MSVMSIALTNKRFAKEAKAVFWTIAQELRISVGEITVDTFQSILDELFDVGKLFLRTPTSILRLDITVLNITEKEYTRFVRRARSSSKSRLCRDPEKRRARLLEEISVRPSVCHWEKIGDALGLSMRRVEEKERRLQLQVDARRMTNRWTGDDLSTNLRRAFDTVAGLMVERATSYEPYSYSVFAKQVRIIQNPGQRAYIAIW